MKNPLRLITLSICAVLAFSVSGCATAPKVWAGVTYSVSAKTAQDIINNANRTIAIGDALANDFLKLEYEHRATILKYTKEPRKYAHYLRQPMADPTQVIPKGSDIAIKLVPRWTGYLMAARGAVKSFKANRTEQGELNLKGAILVIDDMISETRTMTAKIHNTTP